VAAGVAVAFDPGAFTICYPIGQGENRLGGENQGGSWPMVWHWLTGYSSGSGQGCATCRSATPPRRGRIGFGSRMPARPQRFHQVPPALDATFLFCADGEPRRDRKAICHEPTYCGPNDELLRRTRSAVAQDRLDSRIHANERRT
jgi:hypothetical protein